MHTRRRSEIESGQPSTTRSANDRFKERFGAWLWSGVSMATVLHVALLAFFPQLSIADRRIDVRELEVLDLPPKVEIPPAPEVIERPAVPVVAPTELEEEVTIAKTTFQDNPPGVLPEPPSAVDQGVDGRFRTPYDVRPEIRDRRAAERIILRAYPTLLRDTGIGGTVTIWVYIDTNGHVQEAEVRESSGNGALDQAALEAARRIEFTPALNRDRKVPVWISIPITFTTR